MTTGMRTPGRAGRSRTATSIQTARRGRRRRLSAVLPRRRPGSAPRAPFVLLVMALLSAGLIGTLWLSTSAASDSYELSDLHAEVAALTEDTELLRQQVAELEAPGTLAEKAAELGMVPVADPARLLVSPDGSVELVGEPWPAEADTDDPDPASGAAPESGGGDPERQAGLVPPVGEEADSAEDPGAEHSGTGDSGTADDEAAADDSEAP
ncbi:cell division protein FtsI (penicillin-binding protein 3) [Actinoalloteichus hoggarensis]|uniref:Cell division protein FtsL n=1 Tax=Actinoalloteichus hoggarensis TaxID=1470176 RepID=A0A221W1I7_9PSEU|nr:hypothetical protein [Actinoalloteichus hoggarensis]ASO19441.1 Cell division protein FtsL [Actinoalloteichus hoggarensis]MBB5919854.1 cell division protein FtsI (penicillin-binding protein 3) [Actinoalloteichus hoggarensis]